MLERRLGQLPSCSGFQPSSVRKIFSKLRVSLHQKRLSPNPRSSIPKKPGVYVFVVTTDVFDFPCANGLFYIGKATNLYERISAYIGDENKLLLNTKRPLVWRMLNVWSGHLKYFYTTTADVAAAEHLETQMMTALRPPCNRQYDATTSKTMRAF